jgi:4-aminobutyrate aminotransferase
MISEEELAKLSYPAAPKIVTDKIPGQKSQKILEDVPKYESMVRPPGAPTPPVYDEGMGATLKDPDGNIYIDMTAGVAVTSVGRRHPKVLKAIEEQSSKLLHAGEVTSTRRTEAAKVISSIMPEGLRGNCHTYFALSGSGAVETAIKFARHITGRAQILAFQGGYHGVWYGSGTLTTNSGIRRGYGYLMPEVIHVPYAYCYRCAFNLEYPACGIQCGKYVDYVLNTSGTAADNVAAVIIEPHQAEGGYVPPPPEFLKMVKEACDKCGALFIADEVQAGAGRTGKMWSIEHSGIVPDMVIWGKGMGCDLPMAGVTYRVDLGEKLAGYVQPQTFAANALSCAVCMANIDILTDKNDELITRATQVGEEAIRMLREGAKNSKIIGDVRGRGLMIGVELVKDKETKMPIDQNLMRQIQGNVLNRGVIVLPCGRNFNVLRLMPALTITREYLEKAIEIILSSIKDIEFALSN